MKKIYKRNSYTSYLIVDSKFFMPSHSKNLENKYLKNKIVLHSTDYTPLKRTDYLIRAFVGVVKDVPEAILMIIQPMDNKAEMLKKQKLVDSVGLNGRVIFAGKVGLSELPKYYSLADCSVYTGVGSGAGASSYFVLESMSCGTPVVRTSDTNEETIDGVNGYLFDPEDKSKMVNLIIKLLKNSKIRNKFGKSARERIVKMNTAAKVTARFDTLIERL